MCTAPCNIYMCVAGGVHRAIVGTGLHANLEQDQSTHSEVGEKEIGGGGERVKISKVTDYSEPFSHRHR